MIRIYQYLISGISKTLFFFVFALVSCDVIIQSPDTEEEVLFKSSLVASFYHRDYPSITYNQSLAIWDDKAFCFNDTNFSEQYGFCNIIDIKTGEIIGRVTQAPYVVSINGKGPSHLNNACFTDQYYRVSDKYPLLLLSRGDYPNAYEKTGEELYVFRIVEENNTFRFEHIKTIVTSHHYLTTHNPSWEYDPTRDMIWGHCPTEDWRWCETVSPAYRSFNMPGCIYFKAYGTSFVCIESRDEASLNSSVTIRIGNETRVINVKKGDKICEVFKYEENNGGCCFIMCSQNAKAFNKKFDVYTCDREGGSRSLIVQNVGIIGFKSPDLTDSETVTISHEDFTDPVFIGEGIVQGGTCYKGKLFIPASDFYEVNGISSDYSLPVCLIIDPISGIVENVIKLSSIREPEGCAFYNDDLYITHHTGGATAETPYPSFELYKYSLKQDSF